MDDVRGRFLRLPHGTTPAAVTTNDDIIKALQASMIPRHEKLLQYNCKEYLIDINELICVNKILK